ncbi:MAG: hypothetical protein KDE19_11630, partial [Caldilineaceae bacterium]|nr:hypothetical protein [Caldilineaceae bacterium]
VGLPTVDLPLINVIAWLQSWVWLVGNWAIGMLSLIFPTGRLRSPRWRWISRLLTVSALSYAGLVITVTWGMNAAQLYQFKQSQLSPIAQIAGTVLNLAMSACYIGAALSLWLRLRRAQGVERQQMKWFTFAAALLIGSAVLGSVAQQLWPTPVIDFISKAAQAIFLAGMALAIGLAILQHRLFDIDLIIRRTLLYSLLTLTLALLYFGCVVLLENLFHSLTGQAQNSLVTVLSPLVIAALFTPLRRRVQEEIDRRFYRRRYDAEQVLAAFAETVRNETDLERLTQELVQAVQGTMQPTQIVLRLCQYDSTTTERQTLL